MKKTTYLMIGAYIAMLLVVIGFITCVIFLGGKIKNTTLIDGDLVEIPLEKIDTINFSKAERLGEHIALYGFKGIKVSVSDSIHSPLIAMPVDFQKFVDYEVADGCLTINIDVNKVEGIDTLTVNTFRTESYCPLEIVMPEGMLRGIKINNSKTFYIHDLVSRKLTVKSEGRIVLKNCEIDTIVGSGDDFEELKLDDSRVVFADITGSPKLQVNPVNDSSYVEILQLRRK